jgi:hypothetical protein
MPPRLPIPRLNGMRPWRDILNHQIPNLGVLPFHVVQFKLYMAESRQVKWLAIKGHF